MRFYVSAFGANGWVRVSHYLATEWLAEHLAAMFMGEHPGAVAVVRMERNDTNESLYTVMA